MGEIIYTDVSKCEGCNRYVRVCPVEESNIAYMDDGKIRVRIDQEKCTVCRI
jgi:ferredoxin